MISPCTPLVPRQFRSFTTRWEGKGQEGVLVTGWNRMEAEGIGSWREADNLNERIGLGRRSGWCFGGQAQMSIYLLVFMVIELEQSGLRQT